MRAEETLRELAWVDQEMEGLTRAASHEHARAELAAAFSAPLIYLAGERDAEGDVQVACVVSRHEPGGPLVPPRWDELIEGAEVDYGGPLRQEDLSGEQAYLAAMQQGGDAACLQLGMMLADSFNDGWVRDEMREHAHPERSGWGWGRIDLRLPSKEVAGSGYLLSLLAGGQLIGPLKAQSVEEVGKLARQHAPAIPEDALHRLEQELGGAGRHRAQGPEWQISAVSVWVLQQGS